MDRMDSLLSQLPGEPAPAGLAVSICTTIRYRRRSRLAWRLGLSAALALVGVWLVAPVLLTWGRDLAAAPDGFRLLANVLGMLAADASDLLQMGLNGLFSIQGALSPAGASALPGWIALGLSALLLLDVILPREDWT